MGKIHCDDVERMKSSIRRNEAEDQNSIWDRVNE